MQMQLLGHTLMINTKKVRGKSMDKLYGVYNKKAKQFQFGIKEPSKNKARQRLFDKIGNDARKWRFEIREIK